MYINGPAPAQGLVSNALRFDGKNDYVEIIDCDLWSFTQSDFTIELWANWDAPGGGSVSRPGDVFIGHDDGGFTQNKWFFALGGGYVYFHINGAGIGARFFPLVPFSPTLSQWYHLAVSRKGSVYSIYIDGVFAKSATESHAIAIPNSPIAIGQAEGLGYMSGRLDEISIYTQALTAAELKAIFTAGSGGKCKGRAGTSLTGSGSTAIGSTVNLHLKSRTDAGLPYQVGTSTGNGPVPIDTRQLGLTLDALLFTSIHGTAPMLFNNYAGLLDGQGQAVALLNIPNLPVLKGLPVFSAFVTIKAGAPSGIQSISNTHLFHIS